MLLTDARRSARTSAAGELVPLDEQDRSLWDRALILEGVALITDALSHGPLGAYQVLGKPDGSKFYILGTSQGALQTVDSTFSGFRLINGLPSVPTAMAISP